MTYDLDLSRTLTALVASTAGVTEVYPSAPLVRSVVVNLVAAATEEDTSDAKVFIDRDAAGALTVTATIGVDAGYPVPATLRAVGDAVRAHFLNHEPWEKSPVVDVRVSHINADV